jgi:hypothetical protein
MNMKRKLWISIGIFLLISSIVGGFALATPYTQSTTLTVDGATAGGSSTIVLNHSLTVRDYAYGTTYYNGPNSCVVVDVEFCYYDSFAEAYFYNNKSAAQEGQNPSILAQPDKAPLVIGSGVYVASDHTVMTSGGTTKEFQTYKHP